MKRKGYVLQYRNSATGWKWRLSTYSGYLERLLGTMREYRRDIPNSIHPDTVYRVLDQNDNEVTE